MTDIKFLEMAEKAFSGLNGTILEYNSAHSTVLVHSSLDYDCLFLFRYDWYDDDWIGLKCVPNTDEGFQYIMDLYQMHITEPNDYKKR